MPLGPPKINVQQLKELAEQKKEHDKVMEAARKAAPPEPNSTKDEWSNKWT